MKIAWIYPANPRLGNSYYARSYAKALGNRADVTSFDCAECVRDRSVVARINGCDLAHLQYEPAFYEVRGRNRFERVCRAIQPPKVITLHEVYREFPGIFPRGEIRGRGLVRVLKEMVYDARHAAYTSYRRDLAQGFWADALVVHYPYQKEILRELGLGESRVEVVDHPVARMPVTRPVFSGSGDVSLGSSGFINLNYDYEQLFAALDLLRLQWRFTWIGGLRRPEDEGLLAGIRQQIARRGWEHRFAITGWVDEEDMQRHLNGLDVYLALFSNRSTSGTIMKALAARRIIVARDMPLTRDLNAGDPLMLLAGNDPREVAALLENLAQDGDLRNQLVAAEERFIDGHSYAEMAGKLVALYTNILGGAGR